MLRTREESPATRAGVTGPRVWLAVGLMVALRTFRWERAA
jgi:hypothetical protein